MTRVYRKKNRPAYRRGDEQRILIGFSIKARLLAEIEEIGNKLYPTLTQRYRKNRMMTRLIQIGLQAYRSNPSLVAQLVRDLEDTDDVRYESKQQD